MSLTVFAPTARGLRLALALRSGFPEMQIWTKADSAESADVRCYTESLPELVAQLWGGPCLFILAVGAVVRLIAPLLQDKRTDPGVVVVDETGRFVISLSGGHLGGADALAQKVAAFLGVDPVITTAAAGNDLPALDLLGDPYGWRRGEGDWLAVAAAIAQGEPVRVIQTCGGALWQKALPAAHPLIFAVGSEAKAAVWISEQRRPQLSIPVVCWHPRVLWVGVGCERGTSATLIEAGIRAALAEQELAIEAVAGLASIDLKQDEVGLLQVASEHDWPLQWFSAAELGAQPVPHPSAAVAAAVGTPSVAEAAALRAAGSADLLVPKRLWKAATGACTVAVARAELEYSPRRGRLWLIGTGPGEVAQMTGAARIALAEADVVIGYQRYLDLVGSVLYPGQVIEASPITQEVQRAEQAIALARRGLGVAVISSGDAGIYGMAGLVLECLAAQGWDGQDPAVSVLPGVTALQAAAARVGSPLMHDFCAISLSDLLTPWPVIESRLRAAAAADFVVALYNPRSANRTRGIERAHQILLEHRDPATPVVVARSLYRDDEQVMVTHLGQLDVAAIDMLSLVLVGNRSSFLHQGYVITPRGYAVGKNDT